MKKFLLSSAIIVLFGFYLFKTFGTDTKQEPATAPTTPTTDTSNLQTTNVTTPDQSTATVTVPAATTDTTPAATTPAATTTTPTPAATTPETPPTTPAPTTTPKALYKDGSYTGPVTDAVFGEMQVKVTVSGGKITDVAMVKFPNDVANSIKINTNALVKWKTETIATQSAKINIVSGATESSVAFRQSLAAALEQAKN